MSDKFMVRRTRYLHERFAVSFKPRRRCCTEKCYLCYNKLTNNQLQLISHAKYVCLHFNGHFSRWTWVSRYQNVSQFWILLELRMMEVVLTTGATRRANLHVKSSPPTNQHPTFYRPDALSVAQPTASKHTNIQRYSIVEFNVPLDTV